MPTLKVNTEKRIRVDERNRKYNKEWKNSVKEALRNFETTLETGDREKAEEALSHAFKILDKAAGRNILPKKRAARRKSKLHRQFNEKFSSSAE